MITVHWRSRLWLHGHADSSLLCGNVQRSASFLKCMARHLLASAFQAYLSRCMRTSGIFPKSPEKWQNIILCCHAETDAFKTVFGLQHVNLPKLLQQAYHTATIARAHSMV